VRWRRTTASRCNALGTSGGNGNDAQHRVSRALTSIHSAHPFPGRFPRADRPVPGAIR
jgi:hypothetical protein